MVSGCAQVKVQGSQKYAVRVQLDPDKLVAKKIGINEVDTAIQNWNPNLPTGTLYGPTQTYTVTTNAEMKNAAGVQASHRLLAQRRARAAGRRRQRGR